MSEHPDRIFVSIPIEDDDSSWRHTTAADVDDVEYVRADLYEHLRDYFDAAEAYFANDHDGPSWMLWARVAEARERISPTNTTQTKE